MRKIVIAIDGHSSTGKSTVAKKLASVLNYVYVDTGAMYRAVTLYALEQGLIKDHSLDAKSLVMALPKVHLKFVPNTDSGVSEIYLNGENVEKAIRSMKISKHVSKVSAVKAVREKLVQMQRAMGNEKGIVMDGRDIGTVVFPRAELKIFMTASAGTRVHRRYKELLQRGDKVTYEEVLKNVEERDFIDSTRSVSPLQCAKDAIKIDNSDMGLEEQFERIHGYACDVIQG